MRRRPAISRQVSRTTFSLRRRIRNQLRQLNLVPLERSPSLQRLPALTQVLTWTTQ
jgi:hypothetical protein